MEVDPEADPGIKKKMGLNGTAPKETHTHCFSDAFFAWQSKRSTGAISASKSLLYSSKDKSRVFRQWSSLIACISSIVSVIL